jgi:hypothetical protein
MSFNKISLFSLLWLTSCSHIIAMEEERDCSLIIPMENTQQSKDVIISQIREKLGKLDDSILNFSQRLQLAREEKDKDKQIYKNYLIQEEARADKSWFFKDINYKTSEVSNYRGEVRRYADITVKYPGSKDKYESLKKKLSKREVFYAQFVANLQRCESYIDIKPQKEITYLNDVNIKLQELLNAIAKEEKEEEHVASL